MDFKTPLGILRWLLIVSLLSWGAIQGLAQTKAAQPAKPGQPPTAAQSKTKWIKDPSSVMPMRKMTNAERRAAATRNANRQAATQRKRSVPANQGVQQ
ncbi:MAG: hypothetical protein WA628_17955 [Terriglobales bacterium]